MFYSHEILTNTRYGVATVWIAATMGNGSSSGKGCLRRLTRKAIFGVNVPKACDTIIDPGAPLALRLQGKLLYGVSRVFQQQCSYVLSDVEKTHSDMVSFFRILHTHDIDQKSPKASRQLLTLPDNPALDIFNVVPEFNPFFGDKDLFGIPSQGSTNKFSYMTPHHDLSQTALSSGSQRTMLPHDFHSPSLGSAGYRLPSEFRTPSSAGIKGQREQEIMPEFEPFVEEDELDPFQGIGLDFDAEGNLVGVVDREPELPVLPDADGDQIMAVEDNPDVPAPFSEQQLPAVPDEPAPVVAEEIVAQVPGAPQVAQNARMSVELSSTVATTESAQACARRRPGRPRKRHEMVDQETRISRPEFSSWTGNYVQKMEASRKQARLTTAFQAKKNALALAYGNGIAGVGSWLPRSHPLVREFSGSNLMACIQGLHPSEINFGIRDGRSRRRMWSEAFPEEEMQREQDRSVRRALEDEGELVGDAGHDHQGDLDLQLGDELVPELGMEHMDDHHSSSMMPWSRPPSVARGIASSAQKSRVPTPSPLHARGSLVGSMDRRSEPRSTPLRPFAFANAPASSSLNLPLEQGGFDATMADAEPLVGGQD